LRRYSVESVINNKETWDQILADGGSVQNINALDDWYYQKGKLVSKDELDPMVDPVSVKDVYKTLQGNQSVGPGEPSGHPSAVH